MECGEIPPGARSRTYGGHVTRVHASVRVRAYGETGKWECGLLRGADIQEGGHLGLWESDLLETTTGTCGSDEEGRAAA